MEPISKTQQALALMRANPGMSAYVAAQQVGIHRATISRALRVEKAKAAGGTPKGKALNGGGRAP